MNQLFRKDCIFISKQNAMPGLFEEISGKLLDKGLVTPEFLPNLLKREAAYPTAIDLAILQRDLPNIAVPHTESAHVNTRLIIPVKLTQPVLFGNMIAPKEQLPVKCLFMILNNDPEGQANVLAAVMDFVTKNDAAELQEFFGASDIDGMYTYLIDHFEF